MSLPTEFSAPKYSQPECERRFLIAAPPLIAGAGRLLEDRYLAGTRLRLRRETGADGAVAIWKVAQKYGAVAPGVEPMTNLYLTAAEHALLATLPGDDLVKRRHDVWVGDLRYVVDIFGGALAGRMIAEVEVVDAATLWALTPPAWCGREITGEARYSGAALARSGWPAT